MAEPAPSSGPSKFGMLGIVIVLSLLLGAVGGFAAGYVTRPSPAPQAREFTLFTSTLNFSEDLVGQPHDIFVPDHIVVSKGDSVTIHYYNTEDVNEHHTFTMDAPFLTVDRDLGMNENATFNFVASAAGMFAYRCKYHQPSMTGYLIVLG